MNLFTPFEAHRNPLAKLLDRIAQLDRTGSQPLLGRVLILGCRLVAICLPMVLAIANILTKIRSKQAGQPSESAPIKRSGEVSVIILNWNGADLLPRCLGHLQQALTRVPGEHEVIVVDNHSTDNSIPLLHERFPWVKVLPLEKNVGFSRGNNAGVKIAGKDLIMLLNNDIFLAEETFLRLFPHFDDERVFAAAPKVVLENGALNEGHSWGEFQDGMLYFHNERQDPRLDVVRRPALTLYPIGACAIMDRRLYLAMGGLDTMFSPFYWEDDDLGYRALKRGYQVIYDPTVAVVHKNTASSARLPAPYVRAVKEKNMLLFLWKNLTHPPYLHDYLATIRHRVESIIKTRDYVVLAAYLLAFLQAGELVRRRAAEAPYLKLSDKKALTLTRMERQKRTHRNSKPHVLLVTPFLPFPLNNGGAIRVCNVVRHLADRFDFSLLSFIDTAQSQPPPQELAGLFRQIDLVERRHTPVETLLASELPSHYGYYLSVRMQRTLREILARRAIDIVQVEFPWMAYYGAFVPNHPTVFVEHDVGNLFYGRGFTRPEKGLAGLLAPLKAINYERAFLATYDRVITVTDKDRQILTTLFPEARVTTVETGVDLTAFPCTYTGGDGKTLVYLGHYRHYPNEDAALHFVEEIFPLIKARDAGVKLYLVGSHPTRKINRYKGRDDIIVTGSVPDVSAYLVKGTVFIAPIRLGGGIKGKLLEAMAAGLPVVATSLAAAGLGARHGRELMLGDTPQAFADRVLELLKDKELRQEISRNGRLLVEQRFDWRVLAGRMETVYREVLNHERATVDREKPATGPGWSEGTPAVRVANG